MKKLLILISLIAISVAANAQCATNLISQSADYGQMYFGWNDASATTGIFIPLNFQITSNGQAVDPAMLYWGTTTSVGGINSDSTGKCNKTLLWMKREYTFHPTGNYESDTTNAIKCDTPVQGYFFSCPTTTSGTVVIQNGHLTGHGRRNH